MAGCAADDASDGDERTIATTTATTATDSGGADAAAAAKDGSDEDGDGISAYERQRNERIARNQQVRARPRRASLFCAAPRVHRARARAATRIGALTRGVPRPPRASMQPRRAGQGRPAVTRRSPAVRRVPAARVFAARARATEGGRCGGARAARAPPRRERLVSIDPAVSAPRGSGAAARHREPARGRSGDGAAADSRRADARSRARSAAPRGRSARGCARSATRSAGAATRSACARDVEQEALDTGSAKRRRDPPFSRFARARARRDLAAKRVESTPNRVSPETRRVRVGSNARFLIGHHRGRGWRTGRAARRALSRRVLRLSSRACLPARARARAEAKPSASARAAGAGARRDRGRGGAASGESKPARERKRPI